VFSRAAFAWEGLDPSRIWVIPPSIDAFSPKNRDLEDRQADAILAVTGITAGPPPGEARFLRAAGTEAVVTRKAVIFEESKLRVDQPFATQVSRWDRLKDPIGVMQGFADHVAPYHPAHLVLAGPAVDAVADDPEGSQVLRESTQVWETLSPPARAKVHLATLPMQDVEENAVIVNALQRRAAVVIQKSLAEGFGLTVAEAMWKGRPVVASRIGGIQDQIEHGRTGLLIDDPRDLASYGAHVRSLLVDPARAAEMGRAARDRVRDHFLAPRHLMQYVDLMGRLVGGAASDSSTS
jgi:trehalose synthase